MAEGGMEIWSAVRGGGKMGPEEGEMAWGGGGVGREAIHSKIRNPRRRAGWTSTCLIVELCHHGSVMSTAPCLDSDPFSQVPQQRDKLHPAWKVSS